MKTELEFSIGLFFVKKILSCLPTWQERRLHMQPNDTSLLC